MPHARPLILLAATFPLHACKPHAAPEPAGQPTPPTQAPAPDPVLTMSGTVEHMGWTKSGESWNAGGSDYYVLVRDDGERVILRPPPPEESLDLFKPFIGKRVVVEGRRAPVTRFKPDPGTQYPMTDADGYVTTGGGLIADRISEAAVVAPQTTPRSIPAPG